MTTPPGVSERDFLRAVERFKSVGVVVTTKNRRSPEYLTQFVKSEIERWAVPINASGVTLD